MNPAIQDRKCSKDMAFIAHEIGYSSVEKYEKGVLLR